VHVLDPWSVSAENFRSVTPSMDQRINGFDPTLAAERLLAAERFRACG
jgi:hypothetical protein